MHSAGVFVRRCRRRTRKTRDTTEECPTRNKTASVMKSTPTTTYQASSTINNRRAMIAKDNTPQVGVVVGGGASVLPRPRGRLCISRFGNEDYLSVDDGATFTNTSTRNLIEARTEYLIRIPHRLSAGYHIRNTSKYLIRSSRICVAPAAEPSFLPGFHFNSKI